MDQQGNGIWWPKQGKAYGLEGNNKRILKWSNLERGYDLESSREMQTSVENLAQDYNYWEEGERQSPTPYTAGLEYFTCICNPFKYSLQSIKKALLPLKKHRLWKIWLICKSETSIVKTKIQQEKKEQNFYNMAFC